MKPEGVIMLYGYNIMRNVMIMLLFVFWLHYFHVLLTVYLFICLLFFVLLLITSFLFFSFFFLCLFFLFPPSLISYFIPHFRYMIWMEFFKTKYSLDSFLVGLQLVVTGSGNLHGGFVSIILWFVINSINQINMW